MKILEITQIFLKFFILFLSFIFILVSCNNRNTKISEIKKLLEQNCDCKKIESEVFKDDSITTITFNLYDCKYEDDYKEADKIIDLLRNNEYGLCSMQEKINFQFVKNTSTGLMYYPHVYWKCTLQFEF